MRAITIRRSDGLILADSAWLAQSWVERGRGWLGKPSIQAGEGLWLSPASSIHSFGMAFTFDLVFLDGRGQVLKLYPAFKPRRIAFGPLGPWLRRQGLQALELPAGTLVAMGVQVGQTLKMEHR